ncbi:acetylxylan esterase [Olsenella uli]|uniref:acetylxylan esterase n=1 Tax=Olsenella uli TaxID=133926 RepID=UPI0012AC3543|nr:acetylxylan esterase [Olsenella uli]
MSDSSLTEASLGCELPAGFREFWELRAASARLLGEGDVGLSPLEFASPSARYAELVVSAPGARTLRARYVRPATDAPVPLVLAFPDWYQGVRGWHHLTRFVALGVAVVMLDARSLGWESLDASAGWESAPEGLALAGAYTDALRVSAAALALPGIDLARVSTWGEGLGGSAAVAAAALLGDTSWRCAACNPLPAGIDLDAPVAAGPLAGITRRFRASDPTRSGAGALARALSYADAANLASLLRGELLVGTGLMDDQAPTRGQAKLVSSAQAAASVRQVCYPRHAHERINEFENELVGFLVR